MIQNENYDCIAVDICVATIIIGWKTAIAIGLSAALICFAVYH